MSYHTAIYVHVLFNSASSVFIKTIYLVLKFPESDDLFSSGHRAVVYDRRLLCTATFYVSIDGIVAHV